MVASDEPANLPRLKEQQVMVAGEVLQRRMAFQSDCSMSLLVQPTKDERRRTKETATSGFLDETDERG